MLGGGFFGPAGFGFGFGFAFPALLGSSVGATATTGVVENTAEKGPKTISVIDSKATLAPHVGHKVDIVGVNVPVAEAEAMKPAPAKAPHYMRLSAVKMVSATCP